MMREIKLEKIIPWIWMIFGIVWDSWYHLVHGKEMLDSDMASEMILADILNKEHSVSGLSTSWIYSTEIKFVSIQWPFRLGLLFFPDNWHMARSVAMILMICILAFATWLVFYSIERRDLATWGAAFVVFPGGTWYFFHAIFGGYYFSYIFISLFSIVLIIKSGSKRKRCMFAVLAFILGFFSGMVGIKQLMVFYAPLILAVTILYIIKVSESGIRNSLLASWLISLVGGVGSFVGYLINTGVLQKHYMFNYYGDRTIEYNEGFLTYLRFFIWSYGYTDEKVLMSPIGIACMCGVIFGLMIVTSGILIIYRFTNLSEKEQILAAVSVSSIVSVCFIYTYCGGAMQWMIPILPFGYFLIVLAIGTERFTLNYSRTICFIISITILLIASVGTIHNEFSAPLHLFRAQPGLIPVVEMIEDAGYTQGISKFWSSNIVTELTDGKIEMWTLGANNEEWYEWLQKSDHIGRYPEGRYFYLFEVPDKDGFEDQKEELDVQFRERHPELHLIYEDDNYVVYANE